MREPETILRSVTTAPVCTLDFKPNFGLIYGDLMFL